MRQIIEEKNKQDHIESYTAMMSHEFQTPIQTALMLIDVIQNSLNDELALKYLRAMKSSLLYLLYLVFDILDLKMIKQDQFFPTKNTFNPSKAIKDIFAMFEAQAKQKGLKFEFKVIDSSIHNCIIKDKAIGILECFEGIQAINLPELLTGDEQRLK